MTRALIILLIALPLAAIAWSQQEVPAADATQPSAEAAQSSTEADAAGAETATQASATESAEEIAAEVADEEEIGEEAAPKAAATIPLDDPDNADLDQQTYEEDENDFIPTEEIPTDEPIPFPSNI